MSDLVENGGSNMNAFSKFLNYRRVDVDVDRIARLMVQSNIDPNWYIRRYLEALESKDGLICEGWLGGFFKRLSNAWSGFWKDPDSEDSIETRFESAKKSLIDLIQIVKQNQSSDQTVTTILRGIESSLLILNKVEPNIKQMQISNLDSNLNQELPEPEHKKWLNLMTQRDQIIKMPDSEQKLNQLHVNDDLFLKFKQELEDSYQQIHPKNQEEQEHKEQIKNWLLHLDKDASFREIQYLLDVSKKRTGSNLSVQRPQGYEQAVFAFRNVAVKTQDPNQQKQEMLHWYQALPPNNPIKLFLKGELEEDPHLGNELELFWKYCQEWVNKLPHFLATN